ncbi:hypothetical protein M2132_000025 [Dysgonomonas sp. PH5-45]|uniref:alpha-1,2-fucosyltransferase n=1 Tax=unclassified Dysgonomonas TaxID=2630389 RepID=UPI0024762219|nr:MULTISPECIES: alpha-1,2-fucosyltransferase [unclassified Dysgonomonas]MDH6353708.1 hypothetical protein [Dysgonomonas sp. PH5-45]MDH6386611.1 hypothetical protein [Dysgonomonas sp. PH5-37]
MVYTVLNGRLGNNMFQIAAGATLAARNNDDFIAQCYNGLVSVPGDNRHITEYIEQYRNNIFRKVKIEASKPGDYFFYSEPSLRYSEIPYRNNIRMHGWFQSEKYFDRKVVLDLFEIPAQTKEYIENKYGHIFAQGAVNSIHIRRGDYLKIPHYYPATTLQYFKKAIKMLGENERYLILSDDIDWAKQHFTGSNFYFSEKEEPLVDLYLQTYCKNNIISNSSFSWWGAWLNPNEDKTVICPTPWHGIIYKKKDDCDLVPESWVRIKNNIPLSKKLLARRLYIKEKWNGLKRRLNKK